MGSPRRIRLACPAMGGKSVRVQVRMARPVVPGDVLTTASDLDPLREASSAARHCATPARVLIRQVGEVVGVKVVELAD
eukprot:13325700-Alexandrium_andersonii.AAC.1